MNNILHAIETFPKLMLTVLILAIPGFLSSRFGIRTLISYGASFSSIGFSILGITLLIGAIIVIGSNITVIVTTLVIVEFIFLLNR